LCACTAFESIDLNRKCDEVVQCWLGNVEQTAIVLSYMHFVDRGRTNRNRISIIHAFRRSGTNKIKDISQRFRTGSSSMDGNIINYMDVLRRSEMNQKSYSHIQKL
jgi:hypothetical protein